MKPVILHLNMLVRVLLVMLTVQLFFICGPAFAESTEESETQEIQNGEKMMWAAGKAGGYIDFNIKTPVYTEFPATKERMKDIMRDFFRRDYPADKFQALNAVMLQFGFTEFDLKTEDEVVDEYTKGILGVYDAEFDKIYVMSPEVYEQLKEEKYDECKYDVSYDNPDWDAWYHKHMQDIVLVHETTHSLQDENFDLYDIFQKFKNNDDAAIAQRSIVEGEAKFTEDAYFLEALRYGTSVHWLNRYEQSWDLSYFSEIDDYVEKMSRERNNKCKDEMTFMWWLNYVPYIFGRTFIYKIDHEYGRGHINDAFAKCPLSSEQIMNSDKYFDEKLEDPPTFINMLSFDDLIDTEKMRYLDYNSMGQLKLYLLCRDLYFDAQTTCHDTAEGWDGDRYIVWRDEENNILLAWYTTWNNVNDAEEFLKFYNDAWARKTITGSTQRSGNGWRTATAGNERMYVEIKDKDVIIIEGAISESGINKITERLWTSEKYQAGYDICSKTAAEFADKYPGYTGEDGDPKDESNEAK